MATIYNDYPHGMKEKEIEDAIKEYSEEISAARGNINATMVYSPLIQLGQTELQSRQTKRATLLSVIVSFTSLLIAGTALYVSYHASNSSARWEQSQLEVLRKIMNETKNINTTIQNKNKNQANKALNSDAQKSRAR